MTIYISAIIPNARMMYIIFSIILDKTIVYPLYLHDALTFSISADKTAISEEDGESVTFSISMGGGPLVGTNTASDEKSTRVTSSTRKNSNAALFVSFSTRLPTAVILLGSSLTFTSDYDGMPI